MSEHALVENLEVFKQTLPDKMVAIVVDTGKKIFCYGELISESLIHDIECRKIGARRLYAQAKIMEISKH